MTTNLKWKKNLFSNTYSIYSNDNLIGTLNNKSFSKSADGELNGKKYSFKTNGIFNQHTEIIDSTNNKVIGEITYSNWMTKATLAILDKTVNWKYDNIWNTKWSISNSSGIEIKYASSTTSGIIDSNTDDSLLLLSGLFVTNYYQQMTIAVLFVIFMPIWISTRN